jgi:hypothetical protein
MLHRIKREVKSEMIRILNIYLLKNFEAKINGKTEKLESLSKIKKLL